MSKKKIILTIFKWVGFFLLSLFYWTGAASFGLVVNTL